MTPSVPNERTRSEQAPKLCLPTHPSLRISGFKCACVEAAGNRPAWREVSGSLRASPRSKCRRRRRGRGGCFQSTLRTRKDRRRLLGREVPPRSLPSPRCRPRRAAARRPAVHGSGAGGPAGCNPGPCHARSQSASARRGAGRRSPLGPRQRALTEWQGRTNQTGGPRRRPPTQCGRPGPVGRRVRHQPQARAAWSESGPGGFHRRWGLPLWH
jgi:hypothetical protein